MKARNVLKLPAYLHQLRKDLDLLFEEQSETQDIINNLKTLDAKLEEHVNQLIQRQTELEHLVNVATRQKNTPKKNESNPQQNRFVDNHLLDQFYMELENNLRGSEKEVKDKQRTYISRFKKTGLNYRNTPVVDLGSGRGEFLAILNENNIRGIGVDLNESMVERSKAKGLETVNEDALEYLIKAKSNSLGAVCGFHLAEHIPFEQLLTLISEARRALAPGGFLLLETPNPESLFVGAFTFHYDPSHLKPLPPALLEFAAKFRGFEKTEIIRLQPEVVEKELEDLAEKDPRLAQTYERIFGPRDYALVAYK